MALVSAFTLIRSISLFHLTVAFFLFTAPKTVTDQNLVFLLGEAMKIPHVTAFEKASPVTAFLAVIFVFLGVSDLTAISLEDEVAREYWMSITPIRLLMLFAVSSYTYLFKEGGMLGPKTRAWNAKSTAADQLINSVMFTWSFIEMIAWFWVFITLRDERRQAAIRLLEKRRKEAEQLRKLPSQGVFP